MTAEFQNDKISVVIDDDVVGENIYIYFVGKKSPKPIRIVSMTRDEMDALYGAAINKYEKGRKNDD